MALNIGTTVRQFQDYVDWLAPPNGTVVVNVNWVEDQIEAKRGDKIVGLASGVELDNLWSILKERLSKLDE